MSTILHTGRGIYWPQNLPASGYSVRKCQAPNSVSVSAYGILTVSKDCELNHHKSESVLYKPTSRMEVRHTLGVLLWSLPLTVLRICDLFCAIERSKGGGSQPCAWALWADSLWKASALTWFCQWPCGSGGQWCREVSFFLRVDSSLQPPEAKSYVFIHKQGLCQ
jgi:hypothetical protein